MKKKVALVLVLVLTGCRTGTAHPAPPLPPAAPVEVAHGPGPMPWPITRDYYPASEKRRGVTGRVGLALSVDAKGAARDIVVLESGGPSFDAAAKTLYSDVHFRIPADWAASGGPEKRFRYGVVFRLIGKPEVPDFEDGRHTLIITQYQ